jgi:hypothetical protein
MKTLLLAAALFISPAWATTPVEDNKKPETVKVCVDVKDRDGKPVLNKDGTTKQKCRNVRKHQKLEGATQVPSK